MTKQLKEVLFALSLTVISLMLTVQSYMYPPESSDFPKFLTVLMTCFGLGLTIQSYKKLKEETKDGTAEKKPISEVLEKQKLPVFVFLGTTLYVLGINYIGYFTSSVVFLIGSMMFLSKKRNWKLMIIASVGFLVVVYALFVWFLNLRMPSGLLI